MQAWSYPGAADVAGWQPVLSALSSGGPATGPVTAGTCTPAMRPAGSFTLSVDGRSVPHRPAFGWAAQYATTAGQASLSLSQFPFIPLAVALELAAWVVLAAALIGRPRRARARDRGAAAPPPRRGASR